MLWMVAVGYMSQVQAALTVGMDPRAETMNAVATGSGFLVSSGAFAMIILIWAPICSVSLSLAVSRPLEKLSEATREIVEEGNQTSMGAIAVTRNDEIGLLSERYNDLLDMMRDLSRGADAIARGDLTVRQSRQGELPDAFEKMALGLGEMVEQIRKSSIELGSAATEILAATQEQEAAATSQSSAMTEISHTMDSLSQSAAHVSESVTGVLDNAQQTVSTADDMVTHIQNLSGHTGRIAELLDVIRDIADKSDLLALNGSLEASRAGEGGQGFALVAAEMRRLAERVTATVQDVKKMLTDIRASSSSTIMATEESRRLARETTEAARQITIVSQQQRTGTEQVSESVREVANVVTQAAAATSQTRTSAQGLKDHADLLSELVSQFRVRGERG
jgi:methyl-accepting chemotaxis protein